MVINDVSKEENGLMVTTTLMYMVPWWNGRVPVKLRGTGHPQLDHPAAVWDAVPVGRSRLALHPGAIEGTVASSMGHLRVCLPHSLMLCGVACVPASLLVMALVPVGICLIWTLETPLEAAGSELLLGGVLALAVHGLLWWAASRTPVRSQRARFLTDLSAQNPQPSQCAPGSGRAISSKQLSDFFEAFRPFLKDRDM